MSLFDPSKLSSFDIPADVITTANIAIDKLRNRLVDQIDASCIFPGIIVRWSSQMFLQGQVRRSLMFIEGGYDAFLSGRGLVAFTCARAIYETFACVFDFCEKLTEHLQRRHFEKTVAFIHARSFSTRLKDFISKDIIETEIVDTTAVNILTQIDRLSKTFTSLKDDYEFLSERTHPNGLGSLHYFWESGDDIVTFSNNVDQDQVIRSLLTAARLLAIMEGRVKVLEDDLAKIPPIWWRNAPWPSVSIQTSQPTKTWKVGRNDPCPCGSGKKYKVCCLINFPT
jgi:SEC-C motif